MNDIEFEDEFVEFDNELLKFISVIAGILCLIVWLNMLSGIR